MHTELFQCRSKIKSISCTRAENHSDNIISSNVVQVLRIKFIYNVFIGIVVLNPINEIFSVYCSFY